ncbi:sensor histidine kinase [Parafrankia discariae]|uniref:sensor histidine kinase n=1 Tax=Parafrankia discariae TaxID=365528 RepID=UPI0003A40464|nr:sensor histidine kinase [Parafrankia discariae]
MAFVHEALVHRGPAGFLAGAVEFVRAGVQRDEAVLVAVTPANAGLLRSVLGSIVAKVSFLDITEFGRNPGRVIPAWSAFLDEARARGTRARGLGELVWAGRSAAEIAECHHCESLANLAFGASSGLRLRCAYDAATLPAPVVDAAWRTHPRVLGDGAARGGGGRYRAAPGPLSGPPPGPPPGPLSGPPPGLPPGRVRPPASAPLGPGVPEPFEMGLPAPAVAGRAVVSLRFTGRDVSAARRMAVGRACEVGVPDSRVDDLKLAIHEIVTNSVRHGGGIGRLRVWVEGPTLICEVADRGRVLDPLVGQRIPELDSEGGRGLWLAHQLCDLVQLRSSPAGTVVRLHIAIRGAAPTHGTTEDGAAAEAG